ncbi:MAG: hypothetical protein AAF728_05785 [Cyanobacteria bacterium P01_D01_bin.128]
MESSTAVLNALAGADALVLTLWYRGTGNSFSRCIGNSQTHIGRSPETPSDRCQS